MRIGYFLSCEEYTPAQLIEQARLAQEAGFQGLWISDHYHPWNDEQGQSPFVWSMIGALSQVVTIPVTTAVTCPIQRIHPAVVAQAAATSAVLHEGRFVLGVGTGEALNEHVIGARWPSAAERLEMLEESVEVMRKLWDGGFVNHRGQHYEVEQAQVYTRPSTPPKVYMSAFGPKALDLAGRIADGYILTMPDADLVKGFREAGGGDKPVQGGFKAAFAPTESEGVDIAHRLWPNAGLPGELSQVLPSPKHFEQASQLVTRDQVASAIACGPDPAKQAEQLKQYEDAGFDEVYVANIGPNYAELIDMYRKEFL
ncbi:MULTISPECIES: TIGR03557 family F420-dependent LLM class oxidoreductase [Dactylosporangium]|uniref:LLM class F420-dependent oxidoreductase n=2 Tax=Dactylosporangium TaxID=35753 RepID=A0A9W6KR27_9ACTN|nr:MULTISPECIES: TIGR03557 family F420-dependent LLM class oxidoreductase [Dactylosporangium]UAB92298.1 TIGR03557 family F420-dependent LLM class oxidoreductase [Dactylosporangium vinaceum]UWZ49136.1 TIGR03557 family F420-dependent LLM class oxidoreductase [Dactylosporangium matsuzakiense]GLL06542.1 LLM class F420-dependent oxidoreductase [Dactylosporangium matsuzakiense]